LEWIQRPFCLVIYIYTLWLLNIAMV
jgi:hypothetical protein